MKVLHVLPSLDQESGGPLRSVFSLASFAQVYGLESEVVGVGEVHVQDNALQNSLIHSCRGGAKSLYSYSPFLRRWLRSNVKRFDGVVLHGMWVYPNWAAAQECIRSDVPYACFPHGMLEPWAVSGQGWWKLLKKHIYWHLAEKKVFYRAEGALFATRREYELARTVFRLSCLSAILPPFGVDTTAELAANSPSERVLKATAYKYVLILGRIHPKKNLSFLFRAWAQSKKQEGWRLVVAGPGEDGYVIALKNLAKSLEIQNDVIFMEFVSGDDKRYLLQNAKWLVLPSKQENFGIVVLEALQNGCPVAISDQVFLADELKSGAVTLKLRLDDWIRFFSGKMSDESYRRKCVETGRESVSCNYNIRTIAKLWVAALGALFGQRRVF